MDFRQLLVKIGDFPYYKSLENHLKDVSSVLDVGCGDNSPLAKVNKTFYSVGFDIFEPSIKKSKRAKIHDRYIMGDVLTIGKLFKQKSFDAVIALDIIEHFDKSKGWKLIEQMEKIARKKVIIFTPYGFTEQHPYDGNPHQVHRSGWYIEDFKKHGYTVLGMRGLRFIRGEYATIKYRPWVLWGFLSTISQVFVYKNPRLAYQLLAIKNF